MVVSTAAAGRSALMSGPLLLLLVTSQPTVQHLVSATKQEAPPPPSEQSTAALSADDISRPAVSVWSYTAQPDALDFMKAGASPGNTSWTDFFLGGGVCAGGDGAEKTNSGATPSVTQLSKQPRLSNRLEFLRCTPCGTCSSKTVATTQTFPQSSRPW